MRRAIKFSLAAAVAAVAVTLLPIAAGANSEVWSGNAYSTDASPAAVPNQDTNYAIVVLNGNSVLANPSIAPGNGKHVNLNSQAVQNYRAQLADERNDFKQWLQANYPAANVTGEFDIALNAVSVQLNGTPLSALTASPDVASAEYEGLYQPTADATVDPDLTDINAFNAWAANGNSPANAGTGIKVAMVDTGIDITNPCFSDAGYPAQTQLGDKSFTNNKVIVARVFRYNRGNNDYTPEAVQEHGTHTAGTVACDAGTTATVNGVTIPHPISGVAPRALLGNYNVFPGDIANARSENIFQALQQAYEDGMNIDNMSLGGGYKGDQDILMAQVDRFDRNGMLSAVAAGNAGPGFNTVQSPGAAQDALTAGASTVGHFVGSPITVGSQTFGAAAGSFSTVSQNTTATLTALTGTGADGLNTACGSLSGLSGIVLIARGGCTFSTKIRDAQNGGASLVLVANNVAGDPIAMGTDGTPNQPTVPAYMVSMGNGATLKGLSGSSATVGAQQQYFVTGNDNIMAGFSSQGPTNVDFRIKPDVVAPGVNVLSSIPHQYCAAPPCFAFFQGTSMATPHLAGSAAVVEWEHPGWSVDQVRSAIVNTARWGVLTDYQTGKSIVKNPLIAGAGLEDLNAAVHATVALDPVSVSFGAIPGSSSQSGHSSLTLTNLTSSSETLALAAGSDGSGVTFGVSPSTVTIPAGSSATVQVIMSENASKATVGNHYTVLSISSGGTQVAHVELYTYVLPN